MSPAYKFFSADSHVSEPPDLWVSRMDRRFRDRAPHIEAREEGGHQREYFIFGDFPPHPVSVGLAAAAMDGDRREFQRTRGYADARPGGWDPVARLADQDLDGVDGEIIHTTLGFRLFWLEDGDLQRECFRVYNDWVAEYCNSAPERLAGLALISLADVELAAHELQRCAKVGLKGGMIWCSPPEDRPYFSEEYDPFWAAAQEAGMPVVLHSLTGFAESRTPLDWYLHNVVMHHEVERSLATFILSGVLERFPQLKVVSTENAAGWVPFLLNRMDAVARIGRIDFPTKLTMSAGDYFHRQVFLSYVKDPVAIANRHTIGIDNLMWSSDYPHTASSWPRSQEVVAEELGDVPEDERRKLLRDNVRRVYGLEAGGGVAVS